LFDNGSGCRRGYDLIAILRKRFAGKKDRFVGDVGRRRARTALTLLSAVVVTALRAAILIAAPKFAALRRSILGRRKISPAGTAFLMAPAITSAASPAPASAAPAIAATAVMLALAVIAAIIAAVIPAILAGTTGIILSWIEARREVLRRGSVGFRLAFFS
jgi:hypothetical protein